ncbi:MAG TPA: hypothetical protein VES67_20075 [Vicinamibacterales bacterium]|nr:hypothetical protein [Vicinamibacterales bacterium]
MKRRLFRLTAILLTVVMLSSPSPARAQAYDYLVYDESNWWEAVAQVSALVQQILHMIRQARRLPFDMVARYHGHSVDWTFHDLEAGLLYAQRILGALNDGDPTGGAYRQIVDPLDLPTDVLGRMPPSLQRRLTKAYASIELADSVSELAVDQLGAMRVEGPHNLQVAKDMEKDAVSNNGDLHTQIAVLNKINTAEVLGLRLQDHMTKALISTLEQLLVANRRQRDAEAVLLNATIYQWRYGQGYGDDLFRNTATDLDGWRQR